MGGASHNFYPFTNLRRRPDDEATSPALGPDLISLPAWGPLLLTGKLRGVGTEHHCHSLVPEGCVQAGALARRDVLINIYGAL